MNIITCSFLSLLVLTSFVHVESFCYYGKLLSGFVNNVIKEECQLTKTSFMSVGSTQTENCIKCNCTKDGLSCCGIGYKAGVFVVKDCTMKKLDNCCYKFVHNQTGEDCTHVSCPAD